MVETVETGRGDVLVSPDSPVYPVLQVRTVSMATATHRPATSRQGPLTSLWMWKDLQGTEHLTGRDRTGPDRLLRAHHILHCTRRSEAVFRGDVEAPSVHYPLAFGAFHWVVVKQTKSNLVCFCTWQLLSETPAPISGGWYEILSFSKMPPPPPIYEGFFWGGGTKSSLSFFTEISFRKYFSWCATK